MGKKILTVSELRVSVKDKNKKREILHGIDFELLRGETLVILGENGAGKSTILNALMGNPNLKVSGDVKFLGEDLLKMKVEERGKRGIFLSSQSPLEVPGISTTEMLRSALEERGERLSLDQIRERITVEAKKLGLNIWFSERELNVGFSGGEKKKNEILQLLVLKPGLVLLDEIDSGLDVDASKKISEILAEYQEETWAAFIVITHNLRILQSLKVDKTILLRDGMIYAKSEGDGLIKRIERDGFSGVFEQISGGEK